MVVVGSVCVLRGFGFAPFALVALALRFLADARPLHVAEDSTPAAEGVLFKV
jgi:hypothetical protein